jgi:hypothetical protein
LHSGSHPPSLIDIASSYLVIANHDTYSRSTINRSSELPAARAFLSNMTIDKLHKLSPIQSTADLVSPSAKVFPSALSFIVGIPKFDELWLPGRRC